MLDPKILPLNFQTLKNLITLTFKVTISCKDLDGNFHYFFVAFAKEAGLRFNVDHRGAFSVPSFTDLHVIYSCKDTEIMNDVIDKMISNDIITSHISLREDSQGPLDGKIKTAQGFLSESSFKAGARNGYEKGIGYKIYIYFWHIRDSPCFKAILFL